MRKKIAQLGSIKEKDRIELIRRWAKMLDYYRRTRNEIFRTEYDSAPDGKAWDGLPLTPPASKQEEHLLKKTAIDQIGRLLNLLELEELDEISILIESIYKRYLEKRL
jgi:hypothetical protein